VQIKQKTLKILFCSNMSIFDIKLADSKRIKECKKQFFKIHLKKMPFNFCYQHFAEKNFFKS
jgi:hypothetical protein